MYGNHISKSKLLLHFSFTYAALITITFCMPIGPRRKNETKFVHKKDNFNVVVYDSRVCFLDMLNTTLILALNDEQPFVMIFCQLGVNCHTVFMYGTHVSAYGRSGDMYCSRIGLVPPSRELVFDSPPRTPPVDVLF